MLLASYHYQSRAFTPVEIKNAINLLNPHKAPRHDLIVTKILKNLPRKAILLITYIYNSILCLCHFPIQCKLAQIIMISKPGKPPKEVMLYRPISLLPIMAKVSERLLLRRIEEAAPLNKLIPPCQFSVRKNHSTARQCHRIITKSVIAWKLKKCVLQFFFMYSRPSTRSGTKVYYRRTILTN
jgi:hypothetical protein